MDTLAAQACMQDATDLTKWCEGEAQALDPLLRRFVRGEECTPADCAMMVASYQQLLRRVGQSRMLDATMNLREHVQYVHTSSVPAPPVPWWRRWGRRVIG